MAGSRQGRPSRNFPKIGFARFAGRLRASSTRRTDRRVKGIRVPVLRRSTNTSTPPSSGLRGPSRGIFNPPVRARHGHRSQEAMIEIDGSMHSGSGTVLRYAVALAALQGVPCVRRIHPHSRPPMTDHRYREITQSDRGMSERERDNRPGSHIGRRLRESLERASDVVVIERDQTMSARPFAAAWVDYPGVPRGPAAQERVAAQIPGPGPGRCPARRRGATRPAGSATAS